MLVSYYENRLLFVGTTWGGHKGSYIYQLNNSDCTFAKSIFSDLEAVKKWVSSKAGDFSKVADFRLEVFEQEIDFVDEESWNLFAD